MNFVRCAVTLILFLLPNMCESQGLRTLVILETLSTRQTHSSFFAALKDRGHELDYRLPSDSKLALQTYGEYNYDNLIIFGSNIKGFGGSLSVASILQYLDKGHHLLLAVDGKVSNKLRELANECGIDFDKKNVIVEDHQNFNIANSNNDHSLIITDSWINAEVLTGNPNSPVLYRGIGQSLDKKSKLVFPILSGSKTSISTSPRQSRIFSLGKDTTLISALQGRNNARATFVGSLEMFSDRFFASSVRASFSGESHEKSGNEQFCIALAKWTFKETGLLRASNVVHHLADNLTLINPSVYTIEDHIKYAVDISEWSWESQSWKPFVKTDVQLELVRMDPFQRRTMETDLKGRYWSKFQLPHIFGIYHFTIDYRRRGYSHLVTMDQVSVRPYKHNEYERFIPAAYPYYASAFSMLFGFFVFGVLFLYQSEK